jgi:hypothetical protein
MKDEAKYIIEWVAFHRVIGFRDIAIYSNDCTDRSDDLLDALAKADLLRHYKWPSGTWESPQISAYNDFIGKARTDWVCFLDADEFFTPTTANTVGDFLARFPPDVSAIAINWKVFGSNGLTAWAPGLVIERFVRASSSKTPVNRHCKTIARVSKIREVHIHRCFLSDGRYVDSTGQDIEIRRMGFTPQIHHEDVQVNHYVVKSREECEDKLRRGSANRSSASADKFTTRGADFFAKHDRNEDEDRSALRFLGAVRNEIDFIKSRIG